jgi:2-polyprenyl-3-methyl-5-hydroxy-6-metoxy-1,4-benzoquinol methylase
MRGRDRGLKKGGAGDGPGDTLERIVPPELDRLGATGHATYDLHIQRYLFASNHLRGSTVLDIACGVGYGTRRLIDNCPNITQAHGVDISASAIAYAQEHYRDQRIKHFCQDAFSFRGLGVYDTIVSLETVEHVAQPRAFLAYLTSLLRQGGVLVASVPTTPSMDGNPHHRTDFTEKSIRRLGSIVGLREIAFLRQTQPFNIRAVTSGTERRLERTWADLLRFYATHPQKIALRAWASLRYGFVNRYVTIAWEKSSN